jgi:hypothetical protein
MASPTPDASGWPFGKVQPGVGSHPVKVTFVETASDPTLLGVVGSPVPDRPGPADV